LLGLERSKFYVRRTVDPTGKHDNCFYFVLDLDHDRYALAALAAYANAVEELYPELATDLRTEISVRR
jgi:hypothetical protein